MIGQSKNRAIITTWRLKKRIPRFIIIVGDEGSGRLTLAKQIISSLNAKGIISGNSMEEVKNTIYNSYSIKYPTVYIFRDTETMSVAAKNALLKVVEESPNMAYFIMTVSSLNNTLETLKSRATILTMSPYTKEELSEIPHIEGSLDICNTPGLIVNTSEKDYYDCVRLCDNMFRAMREKDLTTILKLFNNLKEKDTDENKVDCKLFFRAFEIKFNSSYFDTVTNWSESARCISKCKSELNNKSINKKNSIESMILSILKENK